MTQIHPAPTQTRLGTLDATIASGQSLSAAVDLKGYTLAGVVMPAAWTAANLTFQVSVDGTTFVDLYDDGGTEIAVTAVFSRGIRLDPALWSGFEKLKVRSGTTGVPVIQAAERAITLALRALG